MRVTCQFGRLLLRGDHCTKWKERKYSKRDLCKDTIRSIACCLRSSRPMCSRYDLPNWPSFLSSDPQKSSGSGLLEFQDSSSGFCRWVLALTNPSTFYHVLQSRFLIAYQNLSGCENLDKSANPIYLLVEDSRSELVMCNWPTKP